MDLAFSPTQLRCLRVFQTHGIEWRVMTAEEGGADDRPLGELMAAMDSQICPRRLHSLAVSLSALLSTACAAGETVPLTSRSEEHKHASA